MDYLLTPQNLKVLESFSIVNTLYAFDYDGTLAPIVKDPDKAYMALEVSELLKRLSTVATIAIITGRSTEDVKKFFDFEPHYIIGNHGIEGTHSPEELYAMELLNISWISKLSVLPPGVLLEKKKYSFSLHYQSDISSLLPLLKELPDATLVEGKSVINVVPSIGMNKGQAMDFVMKKGNFPFGFFIGDDVTDENVFIYKNSRLFTVKVGENVQSHAKYFIKDQLEIRDLLEALIQFQRGHL